MPKVSGVFQNFRDLEKIPVTDIIRWLKSTKDINATQNYIANRILYPQTIPVTKWDLEIDYAILKEVVIRQNELFYDSKNNKQSLPTGKQSSPTGKITITYEFVARFPTLQKLVTLISHSIVFPQAVVPVYFKQANENTLLGSIFTPKLSEGAEELLVTAGGHDQILAKGKIYTLAIREKEATLKLNKQVDVQVFGGEIGVIVKL